MGQGEWTGSPQSSVPFPSLGLDDYSKVTSHGRPRHLLESELKVRLRVGLVSVGMCLSERVSAR